MPELIQYEEDGKTVSSVISAKNGKLNYDLTNLEFGKKYYLHVYLFPVFQDTMLEDTFFLLFLAKQYPSLSSYYLF